MKFLLPPNKSGQRNLLEITDSRQLLIIGANGAGKTRFANYLMGELGDKAFKISGLDALYGVREHSSSVQLPVSIDELYRQNVGQFLSIDSDLPLDKLIALLMNDELVNLLQYKVQLADKGKGKMKRTRLDKVISAWHEIFPGNSILVEGGGLRFLRNDNNPAYSQMRLSDGERAALYYLGAVLYAPPQGVVFIDNPAMFLHPTVSSQIWDKVESMRPDCTFVYTTHDLEFASSRTNNTTVWVREFDPGLMRWDYSLLSGHSGLPEDVYLSIIGARKPVLFIEGVAERSIDYKLYPLIFPQFTVKALGSCNKVIESVRTFNDLNAFHHLDSYGIVDRDRRSNKEVEYLRNKKILVPDVAEVENLLLLEGVVKAVARSRQRDEHRVFEKVKASLLKIFRGALTAQALEHTRHRVKRTVEFRIDGRFSNIAMLEEHLSELVDEINPRGIYKSLVDEFRSMYAAGDYQGVLRVFNDKTMINNTNVATLCGLKNKEHYLATILNILKSDSKESEEIRNSISSVFDFKGLDSEAKRE